MKKKNICILFALIIIILLIPIVTISAASSNNQKLPFSDVDENSKYYDSITYIYDYGRCQFFKNPFRGIIRITKQRIYSRGPLCCY